MRGSQTVRCALATLTIAAACTAGAIPSTSLRASVRGADPDLSLLQQRVDRLDALTQRVEAVSAIKRLQHAYGHYSELGLWHDFADLFADTGIGHYTQGALDREDYVWRAPSRGGWVRVKTPPVAPEVAMVSDFPPDRPLRGSIAAPFPKVHAVPFHYSNPVSGRVPPLLLP